MLGSSDVHLMDIILVFLIDRPCLSSAVEHGVHATSQGNARWCPARFVLTGLLFMPASSPAPARETRRTPDLCFSGSRAAWSARTRSRRRTQLSGCFVAPASMRLGADFVRKAALSPWWAVVYEYCHRHVPHRGGMDGTRI